MLTADTLVLPGSKSQVEGIRFRLQRVKFVRFSKSSTATIAARAGRSGSWFPQIFRRSAAVLRF